VISTLLQRWSLTESKTNSNYGFEMQEVHGPDPITDENIKNDDEVMEEILGEDQIVRRFPCNKKCRKLNECSRRASWIWIMYQVRSKPNNI
jgi:hypothetical protein